MKISVIVPTHNRRALLERKLRALERELGDFEIIVIADGCADGTVEFLQHFGTKLNVQVLELPGLGAAAARNAGVRASSGRVLLFSDDDVIPRSGWVLAHANAHTGNDRAQKNVVAVGRLELPAQFSWVQKPCGGMRRARTQACLESCLIRLVGMTKPSANMAVRTRIWVFAF
jgi:glycosyltransferase involved in cell wall biosynthesis